MPPSVLPYLNNSAKVTGCGKTGPSRSGWTRSSPGPCSNKPAILQTLSQAASACFGVPEVRVSPRWWEPPSLRGAAREPAAQFGTKDALDELLAFGAQFDNIKIQ